MLALLIWLLLAFQVVISEVYKDRFVVRENTPKTLSCENKMENVNRIRWDFTSSQTNTTEIIYDFCSKEILKPGFEVSCFQSHCNLKLLKARKENSGKYVCLVDKTENYLVRTEPIIEIELVIRGPVKQTLAVNIGDSVTLPCEHNVRNVTRTRWSHINPQGVHNYYLYYMGSKEKLDSNYEALCGFHQLACYLKILRVSKDSSGKYICMHGETLEYEEKYGYDEMTYFIEIDLVVGELECNENMNKDLTLVGENDCYGLESDVLNLKCSFSYFGNVDVNVLNIEWIEKHKFNSLDSKSITIPSQISHEDRNGNKLYSIQTNMSVVSNMVNRTFECIMNKSLVKPCRLNDFIIQHVRNTTEALPLSLRSNDLHSIKCSANKSHNVRCIYHWAHEIGGALIENPYPVLSVDHMNSPGVYICIAKCQLAGSNECFIKAMEIEIIKAELALSHAYLDILITSGLVIVIAFLIVLTIFSFKQRKRLKTLEVTFQNNRNPFSDMDVKPTFGMSEKGKRGSSQGTTFAHYAPQSSFIKTAGRVSTLSYEDQYLGELIKKLIDETKHWRFDLKEDESVMNMHELSTNDLETFPEIYQGNSLLNDRYTRFFM